MKQSLSNREVTLGSIVRQPVFFSIGLGITVIFLDLQLYLLWTLPGEVDSTCMPGAFFTPWNIVFSLILSLLIGLNLVGLIAVMRSRISSSLISVGSTSILGTFLSVLTTVCAACLFPVVSFFGLGISLTFLTDYLWWFRSLALVLLLMSLYLINRQLRGQCGRCTR